MKKTIVVALIAILATGAAYAADPLGLNLPTDPVTMSIAYPGATSYWSVTFSGIDPGYDVENKKYPGWCADADTTINPGTYTAMLYSAYDDALPGYAQDDDWDKIAYMVNRYRDGAYSCATKYEIQALVWYYLEQSGDWGTPDAACMASIKADVDANGEGYTPQKYANDIAPVICDTDEGEKQLIFVEIPYFPAPEVIAMVAAIALGAPAFGYLTLKRKK